LCLSLGFEGKFRVMERGMLHLEAVRDGLYRQIRQVRGNPSSAPVLPPGQGRARGKRLCVIPARWFVAFTLCCLLAMYAGFSWMLERDRTSALQNLQLSASEPTRTPL
ncbi:MAG: DotU family type IV/VI secretion system protein, partial [Proteobacteria bacterium]